MKKTLQRTSNEIDLIHYHFIIVLSFKNSDIVILSIERYHGTQSMVFFAKNVQLFGKREYSVLLAVKIINITSMDS